jgi:hypothetical protein
VVNLYNEGKVEIEILKDMDVLTSKGYFGIYEELEPLL